MPSRPPLHRSRRRRTAVVSGALGYVSMYGAGVLGILAFFLPTGRLALQLLAAAALFGVITGVLLAVEALTAPRAAPRLQRRGHRLA